MMRARRNVISTNIGAFSRAAALVCLAGCTENPPPIPDLSGQWGRDMVNFEPPLMGPDPIVNTVRKPDGTMDTEMLVGDYASPILKPEAAEAVRSRGAISLSGKAFPDPHNQCWPEPPPYTMAVQFGLLILQQSDKVTLLYLGDHKVRHVPLNVSHPPNVVPTWQGRSVARYEGDTLVIDTVGVKVGPLSMVDWYGTPHSEALHVIERYRLIDGQAAKDAQTTHERTYTNGDTSNLAFEVISPFYGRGPLDPDPAKKGLQVEFTVEDPGVFNTAWSGLVTYRPVIEQPPAAWPEIVCAENTREFGAERKLPTAEQPDF